MKTKLATICLVLGAALVPVAAYSAAGDTDSSKARTYVKDSVITTKIKADYAKDKIVSALHIKVETDAQGVVYLSGTAKSQMEADKAIAIAKNVKGVTDVNSDIVVSSN
jgi:hyperosmotically inducible protein